MAKIEGVTTMDCLDRMSLYRKKTYNPNIQQKRIIGVLQIVALYPFHNPRMHLPQYAYRTRPPLVSLSVDL
jgi:hypothetical protein